MYPKKFEDLIAAFRHLPGVGIKTAERYAFTVLDWDQETLEEMIASLQAVRNGLDVCEVCGNLYFIISISIPSLPCFSNIRHYFYFYNLLLQ